MDWLPLIIPLIAVVLSLLIPIKKPSSRTREAIGKALAAQGFKLVDVQFRQQFRLGKRSNQRSLVAATALNPFGNKQTKYFDVSFWSDLFSADPDIRERSFRPSIFED